MSECKDCIYANWYNRDEEGRIYCDNGGRGYIYPKNGFFCCSDFEDKNK
ncbi:MAG: hypothetical protein IJG62_00400 [Synergistaceae bacterium]|nr:hypothetical protein [Synergistaceae bacterium]MBQ3626733.1 hypothetical protein [Synergistaceae bacterium]MBQ4418470.1 hypothetical protein [Synergistaceae bacterium]MBQ6740476.1 hypothetical protein [Synergistaceae bacterium]MBQ6909629.1 hypothetical protein [Synergistaceae bacterium]